MTGRWSASPRVARVLGVAALSSVLAAVPLAIVAHGDATVGLALIPFGIVGAVIARRQPRNPVGPILLLLTFVCVICSDAGGYAQLRYRDGYGGLPLGRVAVFMAPGAWIWLVVLLPLPLALFPDGRLSQRWRRVLWGYLVLCAAFVATTGWQDASGVLAPHMQVGSNGQLASFGSSGTSLGDVVTILLFVGFCLAWVGRLLLGYRRATGDYRQQLKWALSGGAIGVSGLVLAVSTSGDDSSVLQAVGGLGFLVALVAFPVGIGVGILKYRLYDIDRLISRTVSYAILTGLLVGVFVGIVVLATDVLPFASPVGVAASTLAAAALFNPLRKRVQHAVDRRFNRARYDAEATVAAFTMRLRDAVDLDTVRYELLLAVNGAVEPAHASLWIRPPSARNQW